MISRGWNNYNTTVDRNADIEYLRFSVENLDFYAGCCISLFILKDEQKINVIYLCI